MLTHELLPPMTPLPAGVFEMGSERGAPDECPVHEVEIDRFHLGTQPVTNGCYARFVAETGYRAPGVHELPLVATLGGREGERTFRQLAADYVWVNGRPPDHRRVHPVTLVTRADATAFCLWMTRATGLPVRLPTEAEWEYAARGGDAAAVYPTGETIDTSRANYLDHISRKWDNGTTAVGAYDANAAGLQDMAGNVWEWVEDWYDAAYYAVSPRRKPAGPRDGRFRGVRGGGWAVADPERLRLAARHRVPVDTYSYTIGFRIAYGTP